MHIIHDAYMMFAGTRYLFVGKLYERRPSYHLLGVLLFVQLGISAGTWALSNLASSLNHTDVQRGNADMPAATTKALKAAIVIQVLCPSRPLWLLVRCPSWFLSGPAGALMVLVACRACSVLEHT